MDYYCECHLAGYLIHISGLIQFGIGTFGPNGSMIGQEKFDQVEMKMVQLVLMCPFRTKHWIYTAPLCIFRCEVRHLFDLNT